MHAMRRLIRCLKAGAPRPLALAYLLGAFAFVGHLGTTVHAYEHFTESQPEVICHLCAAGDHHTPLSAAGSTALRLDPELPLAGHTHAAPVLHRVRAAHGVRAPPHTA